MSARWPPTRRLAPGAPLPLASGQRARRWCCRWARRSASRPPACCCSATAPPPSGNRSEAQLSRRRASEKLALLIAALDRDMKGAQLSVLVPINQEQLPAVGRRTCRPTSPAHSPLSLSRVVLRVARPQFRRRDHLRVQPRRSAAALGRGGRSGRAVPGGDAPPAHGAPSRSSSRSSPTRRTGSASPPTSSGLPGVPYQVVVHLLYDDITGAGRLFGLVGYTVNLPIGCDGEYFEELVGQVSQIGGADDDMAISHHRRRRRGRRRPVAAGRGRTVAATCSRFPIRFFDRNLTQVATADDAAAGTVVGPGDAARGRGRPRGPQRPAHVRADGAGGAGGARQRLRHRARAWW